MAVSGWNVTDVIIGALGILATIIPLFAVWTCAYLPKKKLSGLEEILEATQKLFSTARTDELITDQEEINQLLLTLEIARAEVNQLCATVHSAHSIPQKVRNWRDGISGKISEWHSELNIVRVKLAQRSSDERRLQIARNLNGAAMRPFEEMAFTFLSSAPSSPVSQVYHCAQGQQSNNLASPEATSVAPSTNGIEDATPVAPSTNGIEDFVVVSDEDTLHSPHTIDRHPTPDRRPTHHHITSDAHLQSLHRDTNHCNIKAGARDATLPHTERRLHAPGYTRKTFRYRFVRRARPTVVHIYRYVFYGAPSGDGTPLSTLHDPESLLPRGVRYGDDANADDS
ncbi:hypothetical protein C2E23DRAFT_860845 [Lenzites betulinus]|nr:hypothetical protein C2E23DRAFT_860845 [Lenzites betulinus]